MSQNIADRNGRLAQALVLAQLLLAFGGMIVFIFAPRAGEPVTLLPLSEDAAFQALRTKRSRRNHRLAGLFLIGALVVSPFVARSGMSLSS